jgi:uncharacterized protein YjbI with pentapeptide repeats
MLHGANLSGAIMDGVDMTGAKLDGQIQLDGACGAPLTLPTGLTVHLCSSH